MLNRTKNKIYIIFFLALFLFLNQGKSFGAWDIVKAKTIELDENEKEVKQEQIDVQYDPDVPNFEYNNNLYTYFEKKIRNFVNRRKHKDSELENEQVTSDIEGVESVENSGNDENIAGADGNIQNNQKISLDKVIYEETPKIDDKNRFEINADKIYYDDEIGDVIAQGHVEIIAHAQDVVLKADNAILHKENQTIQLNDNVKIIKDNTEMKGEFLLVDLNEENILMDNPTYSAYSFEIKAQEGYLIANNIQMLNGTIKSANQKTFPLVSKGFLLYDSLDREFDFTTSDKLNAKISSIEKNASAKKQAYRIDAKNIVLTSYKDHNSIQLLKSNIYYNDKKIIRNSDIEIISDKKRQVIETNTPEIGNLRNFGTYLGYGFVEKLWGGQTIKLMPVLAYSNSDLGIGLIARHRSKNSIIEGGWNTASENFVVKGKYRLSDSLTLNYGRNSYIPDGFMGSNRFGYGVQLQYLNSYKNEDLDIGFSQGFYAGLFSDYQKHRQEHAYSTTRFRYMAEARKRLFDYKNEEQDMSLSLSLVAQGAASVYGSGETVGVARLGPSLSTKLKRWESSIGYFLAGVHGESPFHFDEYRYGKSSIVINEKINLTDKFALGFRTYVSPLKDNYNDDLLTECRFYTVIGPKDLKVAFSYDFVRDLVRMDFMFLIGSDSSKINFEKLTTKNLDDHENKQDFYKNSKPIKINPDENIDNEMI